MTPIRQLPPAVADAIAAGEVVERPASVVKELCENALDAGATRLEVSVEGGGTARIRVVDDGGGIPAADLRLAVARHATSKLATVGDLAAVRTLGFRGEALASIAAVSEVLIASRTPGAGAGARLRVRGSEVLEEGPVGVPPGTAVEVRDLFFSTPARLRFLRAPRTEMAACARVVADLALSHPAVAVTCRLDGRVSLRSPGGPVGDALRAVLGSAAAAELIAVAGEGSEVAVTGAISEPRAHRGTRGQVVLVVNGRRVHNRALAVAVEEAYRGLLPGSRWPYGLVVVDLDPAAVDVNVHPAKREVRFREEGQVFAAVQRACWDALRRARPYAVGTAGARGEGGEGPLSVLEAAGWPAQVGFLAGARGPAAWASGPSRWEASRPLIRREDLHAVPPPAATGVATAAGDALATLRPLRALGQASHAWMVAESPVGVVLVDPHAAHEKVLYAELLAALTTAHSGGAPAAAQLLLIPVLVEVDAGGVALAEEEAARISALGFDLRPFGPASVRCAAVPVACGGAEPERLVRDLLEGLDPVAGPAAERDHRLAALLACHSAVRLGDALPMAQQQTLLDRLVETPGALTCPHGRPTVLVLDDAALRHAFRRPPLAAPTTMASPRPPTEN